MARVIYRFGDYLIDPQARELCKAGRRTKFSPKSFDCIAYLIEHKDRAVGRDELISAVWGRVDVNEALLAQTIARARRAVGDSGEEQHSIRTVSRFGYRWVRALDSDASVPPAAARADNADLERAGAMAPPGEQDPANGHTSGIPAKTRFASATWNLRSAALICVALIVLVAGALAIRFWSSHSVVADAVPVGSGGLTMVLPVVVDDQLPETVWLPLGGMQLAAEELRRAHLGVLSIAQTLLLVKEGSDQAERYSPAVLGELMATSHATRIIAPRARQTGNTWHCVVDVFEGKRVASFEGDAGHSLDALRLAINAFLGSQGLSPLEQSSVLPSTELALRLDTARSPDEVAAAERLLAAAPDELRNLPEITVRAGSLALKSGDMPRARALFGALAATSGLAPEVSARVQAGLGSVAIGASAYTEAETHFSSALALLAEQGDAADPALVARTYLSRGGARSALGRFDEGLDDLGRARVAMERIGDEIGIGEVDWNLGLTQAELGRYEEATKTLDRAIDVFSRFGISDSLAVVLVAKAEAQLALLQYEDALTSSSRASELVPKLTYELLVEHVQTVHIKALLLTGRLAKAETELDRMATRLPGDARFVADLLQAALLEQRGSRSDAATRVHGALTATGQLPASREQRPAEMALLLLDASRNTPAMKTFDQGWPALASAEAANDRDWPWVAALAEAEILAARADDSAPAHFAAAMESAERRGSPWAIARTGTASLLYLQRTNNLEKVPALVGRLAPYARQDFRTAIAAAAAYKRIGADRLADEMLAQAAQIAGERNVQTPPW